MSPINSGISAEAFKDSSRWKYRQNSIWMECTRPSPASVDEGREARGSE